MPSITITVNGVEDVGGNTVLPTDYGTDETQYISVQFDEITPNNYASTEVTPARLGPYAWYQQLQDIITDIAKVSTKTYYEQAVTALLYNFKAEEKEDMLATFIGSRDSSATTYTVPMEEALRALQIHVQEQTGLTVQEFVCEYGIYISPEFSELSTRIGFVVLPTVLPPTVSVDIESMCYTYEGNIVLTATDGLGTQLVWSANSCEGTRIGTGSQITVTAPDITTTYYAAWTGPCGNSECGDATVYVETAPSNPWSASSDRNDFCASDSGTITLSSVGGSAGPSGVMRWYAGSCGGTSIGTGQSILINSPTTTTTYYCRWENACGNSNCASITVTVYPAPESPAVSVDRGYICTPGDGTITLTATGGSGDVLMWYSGSCDGTDLGTDNPLTISAPTETTTYYAAWTNVGCGLSACDSVTVTVNAPSTLYVMPESTGEGAEPENGDNFYHVGGLSDDGLYVMLTFRTGDWVKPAGGGPAKPETEARIVTVANTAEQLVVPYWTGWGYGRGVINIPGVGRAGCGAGYNGSIHNRAFASCAVGTIYGNGSLEALVPTADGKVVNCETAKYNAMSVYPSGPGIGNGWIVGKRTDYSVDGDGQPNDHRDHACAWRYIDGCMAAPLTAAYDDIIDLGITRLSGTSSRGVATGWAGEGAAERAILLNVTDGALPSFKDADGYPCDLESHAYRQIPLTTDRRGQATGISANSQYICGYFSPPDSDDSYHAFRYDTTTAYPTVKAQELLPLGGDIVGIAQQCNAHDTSNDGTTVGYSWRADTNRYTATVWRGTNTTGESLADILDYLCVDTSEWDYFERCVSITADGMSIAGRGMLLTGGDYRAFVITFPQPLTADWPWAGIIS